MSRRGSLLRAPSGGSIDYEEWRDEASCKGLDTDLFEIDEELERGEEKQELIAWGLKICSTCPVRKPCGASATEMDKYWSTRGGQPPEGLFPDSKRPAAGNIVSRGGRGSGRRDPKEFCINGHKDWYHDKSGYRRCATCRRDSTKSGWEKRKAKREKLAG